jgi:hypothetical protein
VKTVEFQKEKKAMKGAAKRQFLVRGAPEHRTSRSCPRCQQNNLVPTTRDEIQKPNDRKLDYRSCTSCDLAVTAGDKRSDVLSTMAIQKDQVACINICRGGIAGMQLKRRPNGLQTQEYSL